MTTLVWLRDDLRLADNPALVAAAAAGRPVVALYVLDDVSPGVRPLGAASRWWLAGSLAALAADLAGAGVPLLLRRGAAGVVVPAVAAALGATAVHWNRRYHPAAVAVDHDVTSALAAAGRAVASHQANLLFEPMAVSTAAGGPIRVFTPYWRACRAEAAPRPPLPRPVFGAPFAGALSPSDRLDDWNLRPTAPDWAAGLRAAWTPGEAAAEARLAAFLAGPADGYAANRDRPAAVATSRLSPHLRFGEISPFRVWQAVADEYKAGKVTVGDLEKFRAELGWREFSWHLVHRVGDLAERNFNAAFDRFAWRDDPAGFAAWRRGRTGVPLVDAGMRELWRTGWMHNRVRMVVASFLTKHLLVDWRAGERWFWDTLVDADAANNPAGWQWVAGSGADAQPFFRVFNPATQGETHDPDAAYIRANVAELADLAAADIHDAARRSRRAPAYPRPIVDLAAGRARALAAFAALRAGG
jgi:deoxyribodipyrimidine photo-lyase